MLNQTNIRSGLAKVLDPVASGLLKLGLTPDMITVIGTVGVSAAALIFFPSGKFVVGVLVIVLFIFSDMIDGAMARQQQRSGPWGAFLDSTLDRVADGFVFAALVVWAAKTQSNTTLAAALICLVGGFLVSYAKARAEGLGMTCNIGVAERSERLIIILVAAFVYGLGVAYVLPAALWVLAALVALTVAQRFAVIHRQSVRIAAGQSPSPVSADDRETGGTQDAATENAATENAATENAATQNAATQNAGADADAPQVQASRGRDGSGQQPATSHSESDDPYRGITGVPADERDQG